MINKDSILKELEGSKVYEEMKAHLYSNKPVLGEGSPFSALLQTLVNTMLVGEVNDFLESEKEEGKTNKRNGYTKKKVISNSGELEILTPRDRNSEFEPALIGKREKELSSGLDEQIMALYAQGNSIEDVRRLLVKMFGVEISSGKISHILDQILPELQAWRDRRLKPLYSVIYLDAIRFKIREEGKYITKAFYTVYAVD